MSTKTDLQALITAFTDGGANTAAEFRTFATSLLNSVIPDPLIDTQATTNVLTVVTPGDSSGAFQYNLTFWKQGAMIFVKGFFKNATGNTQYNEDIATITNAAYLPLGSTTIKAYTNGGTEMILSVSNDKIHLNNAVITNQEFYFSDYYPALN